MTKSFDVSTGNLMTADNETILKTTPLGSCVAVIAYDKSTKIGGIAHIMLPGRQTSNGNMSEENKYAWNAIGNLFLELSLKGVTEEKIEICLVGGANVLKRENEDIGDRLVASILEIVKQKTINIKTTSLGGDERRTARLDLKTGILTYTTGNKKYEILYDFYYGSNRSSFNE